MINRNATLALLAALVALTGCATRPRDFDAVLANPPADGQAYLRDYATCRYLVRSNFRRNTSQQAAVVAGTFLYVLPGIVAANAIRSDREKRLNQQMSTCLEKYGYQVAGWTPVSRKAPAKAPVVTNQETSK